MTQPHPGQIDPDVVVLGGGMAGLSFACALAQSQGPSPLHHALVLEPRPSYAQDKTWCYWQQGTSPFDQAITHRWQHWTVSHAGHTHTCSSTETPYVRVDSGRFYEIAQGIINDSKAVSLRLGARADRVDACDEDVTVTSGKDRIRTPWVIDTRPTDIPDGTLLQHFMGWEIQTDQDVFDPSTVTLMDFAPAARDIHFFYVLPFSRRRALVETTHFSMSPLKDEQYRRELGGYLQTRFGLDHWQITRTEQGVIPMPRRAPNLQLRGHKRVIPLGLHADTTKPSTGYCYPHAQDQAKRQARALLDGNFAAPPGARSELSRWFDAVFIGFLERYPERAGSIFLRLFQQVPSDALIRFLTDKAQPGDYLKVMTALPKGTFIRQALSHAISA